jgi:para-nitrobenzyl esterase
MLAPTETSEDCLYLNVWRPATSPGGRLAVMVWIYGGGFTAGNPSAWEFNGGNLAKKGVIVVTFAYRLGAFGFLAHPELSAQNKGHSGNYGLFDQIAALQWVQRNIAAFGGDSHRVTIFGQSAGGMSVSMLAASPLAKGLFQGAISESGASFAPPRFANEGGSIVRPLALAEKNGKDLLKKLGVVPIADARNMSGEDLQRKSLSGPGQGMWLPNFDGDILPGDQYKLYEAGHYNDTPILIGTNSDEGSQFVAQMTAAAHIASVGAGYGDYAEKILTAYPGSSDAEALRSARDLLRDSSLAWPTWTWARLQARTGTSKVFVYYFSHRPPYPDTPRFKDWGATHGGELPFVFGNFAPAPQPSDIDLAVSDQVSSYWVNFAKTGDPNGTGLPRWPAFTSSTTQVMNLDSPCA